MMARIRVKVMCSDVVQSCDVVWRGIVWCPYHIIMQFFSRYMIIKIRFFYFGVGVDVGVVLCGDAPNIPSQVSLLFDRIMRLHQHQPNSAPHSYTHSFTHSFTHSLTGISMLTINPFALIHSLTHSRTHSLTHSLTSPPRDPNLIQVDVAGRECKHHLATVCVCVCVCVGVCEYVCLSMCEYVCVWACESMCA